MPTVLPLATSPALDLSGLPAPDVVEQLDFETILAAMVADLTARWPDFDALVESEPAMKLLQVCAYRELVLRQNFNDRARSLMLAFAGGADLDHLAALFGVTRLVVTPANPVTGAAAVLESDDALRRRILLAPDSWSIAGPASAYVYHALSAAPTLADASATSPSPGEVVVAILSASGTGAANAGEIAAVEAVVNADGVRPLTDHVTVQSAQILPYAVQATLTLYAGPDSATIMAAAQASIAAFTAAARRLGRDVPRSALIAALHVGGVQKVALAQPSADVICTPLQAANCTGITLSQAGVDE